MSADRREVLYRSPLGPIGLAFDSRLRRVRLLEDGSPDGSGAAPETGNRFVRALDGYFAGGEVGISLSALDLSGRTEFQRDICRALIRVPRGELLSYGELARAVDRPGAARAVGQALARNPVPIFVPCHRVVRADGGLGGFSGGPGWKRALLRAEGHRIHEGRVVSAASAEMTTP